MPLRQFFLAPLFVALTACGSDDNNNQTTPPPAANTAGSYTITFTNQSVGQPMTPPVVAIHDVAVKLFTVGSTVSSEVQAIAENGNNDPLVALASSLSGNGVSASGVAAPNPAGPILPGESSTITLNTTAANQVISVVSMVVCTNDGFTGLDSAALPLTSTPTTLSVSAYDAGSEVNEINPDYWVPAPPCGGTAANMHDDEGGVIAAHPGQAGSFDANLDFAAGASMMQIQITRN